MISFRDVVDRALDGPIISGKDFDLKLLVRTARRLAKEYDVRYDPETLVPADDNLADRVWQAGVELFLEVGVYCPDTERRITFSRDEVELALAWNPGVIKFGSGVDRRAFPYRRPEDPTPPWCSLGAGGGAVSSDFHLLSLIREYARNPLCDSITTPSLTHVDGELIVAGSPLEVEGAIRNMVMGREALRQAGRPGLPIVNGVASATHASSHIAGAGFGIGPTDAMEIGAHHEMRVDFDSLNKVAYTLARGWQIWAENGVILGGMAGGPATTAIVTAAYNLLDMLVLRGSTQHPFPIHFDLRTTTTRDTLWVRSVSNQAITRNSWLPVANLGYIGAGPTTEMALYETVAWVTAAVVCGGSIEAEGVAKNAHVDHTSPVEPYFASEVAHAVAGMSREEANGLVKALLEEYEARLPDAPIGVRLQDCMNLENGEISSEFREMYRMTRQAMTDRFGLKFKYPSIYL
jgi:methylamine--corrinoid protein Co-methyltransferase